MDKDIIAIKDIKEGMKNINVLFIVLELTSSTKTKDNRDIFTFKVADSSACINCVIWDEPGKHIQPGDIIRVSRCYANVWKECLNLTSGKLSEITRMGDFMMVFNENLNMSEPKKSNEASSSPQPSPSNRRSANAQFHQRRESVNPFVRHQKSYMESLNRTPRSPLSNSNSYSNSNSSQSPSLNDLKPLVAKRRSMITKESANTKSPTPSDSQSCKTSSNISESGQRAGNVKFFSPKPLKSSPRTDSTNPSQSSSSTILSDRKKRHVKRFNSPKPTTGIFGTSISSSSNKPKPLNESFNNVICLSDSD